MTLAELIVSNEPFADDDAAYAWADAVVHTEQKMQLLDLIGQLDDWGELGPIQASASSGLAKKQAGQVPDATESVCLDALTLMETSRKYGRETVNWAKQRHLDRLNALVTVGMTTQAHADDLVAMAPVVTQKRFQRDTNMRQLILADVSRVRGNL